MINIDKTKHQEIIDKLLGARKALKEAEDIFDSLPFPDQDEEEEPLEGDEPYANVLAAIDIIEDALYGLNDSNHTAITE